MLGRWVGKRRGMHGRSRGLAEAPMKGDVPLT